MMPRKSCNCGCKPREEVKMLKVLFAKEGMSTIYLEGGGGGRRRQIHKNTELMRWLAHSSTARSFNYFNCSEIPSRYP